jgi:hypothetical protein
VSAPRIGGEGNRGDTKTAPPNDIIVFQHTENIFYTDRDVPPSGPAPKAADKVTVGGKTYTRPATMTDTQWNAYKRSVGAQ